VDVQTKKNRRDVRDGLPKQEADAAASYGYPLTCGGRCDSLGVYTAPSLRARDRGDAYQE